MTYSNHFYDRMNHRGITSDMVDCVLMFGEIDQDKYILNVKKAEKIIADIKKIKTSKISKNRKGKK